LARVLYVIGSLGVIGSALWLFEVLRQVDIPSITLEYQGIAWAAAIPALAMLGGFLIVAFAVVLERLKAIQYASERSLDALAKIAARSRS
jgi:hypothetical protein